jgi:kynurenine formamidase
MCTTCLMDDLKRRMLSRRDLFRGAGAAGLAAVTAASFGTAPAALAQGHTTVEDLTHELTEDFPTFFGDQQLFIERKFDIAADGFNLFELRVNEHTGTHMDAPLHFSADGRSVAEIPVGDLVVPLCVVDIRAKADADPDAQVTPDDLAAWIAANGPIPDRACVAMLSGWQSRLGTAGFRNADDAGGMHFPGFHVEAAQMLIDENSAVGIATDTLSLDHGASPDFATHYAWLPTNRWGIEAIANLERAPVSGATLVVGAPKHRGGTGGPARVFALV